MNKMGPAKSTDGSTQRTDPEVCGRAGGPVNGNEGGLAAENPELDEFW